MELRAKQYGIISATVFEDNSIVVDLINEKRLCVIILNLDQWIRCCLKSFILSSSGKFLCPGCLQNLLSKFAKGHYEEQLCEVNLNLDKPFNKLCRCFYLALVVILFI